MGKDGEGRPVDFQALCGPSSLSIACPWSRTRASGDAERDITQGAWYCEEADGRGGRYGGGRTSHQTHVCVTA